MKENSKRRRLKESRDGHRVQLEDVQRLIREKKQGETDIGLEVTYAYGMRHQKICSKGKINGAIAFLSLF